MNIYHLRENLLLSRNKLTLLTITLMLIFFIKGIIYSTYIVPPMMGMSADDVGHFSYIQYLALERKLPVLHVTSLEEKPFISFRNSRKGLFLDLELNRDFQSTDEENWIIQHPPLYYLVMVPFYWVASNFTNSLAKVIVFLRISTVLIGILTIFIIYKILQNFNTNFYFNCCILLSFTFSPAIQFYFSNITNDSLVIFLCTTVFFFLIKFFRERRYRYFFFFVLSSACVLLTKYTGALILIGYSLLFLALGIKNFGIKKTISLCFQGIFIGIIIITPYFYHNFRLYNNLFWPGGLSPANSKESLSFTVFLTKSGYFDELYNHICLLVGWENLIQANYLITFYIACIIAVSVFLYSYNLSNYHVRFLLLLLYIILILLFYGYLKYKLTTAIAIGGFLLIGLCLCLSKDENKMINFLLYISIAIMLLIFTYQHYNIYSSWGYLKATHGRYYYIAFFPTTYLVFFPIKNIRIKFQQIFATILLICQISCEFWMLNQALLGLL